MLHSILNSHLGTLLIQYDKYVVNKKNVGYKYSNRFNT